jgi:hypothetical protein
MGKRKPALMAAEMLAYALSRTDDHIPCDSECPYCHQRLRHIARYFGFDLVERKRT